MSKIQFESKSQLQSEDFAIVPLVLNKFDTTTFQKEKTKLKKDSIKYEKKIGKIYIVCEEIITENKELSLKTLYIKNAPKNGLKGIFKELRLNKGLQKLPPSAVRPKRSNSKITKIQKTIPKNKTIERYR